MRIRSQNTPDPVIAPYDPNGACNYLFCNNNPTVYIDPFGLQWTTDQPIRDRVRQKFEQRQDFEKNWGRFVKLDFNQDGIVTQQEIGRYVNTQARTAGLYIEIINWLKARDIPIGRPPEFAVPEKPEWTETEKQYNNDRLNRGLTTASYIAAPFAGAKFVTAIPKIAPHVGNAIGGMGSAWHGTKAGARTAAGIGKRAASIGTEQARIILWSPEKPYVAVRVTAGAVVNYFADKYGSETHPIPLAPGAEFLAKGIGFVEFGLYQLKNLYETSADNHIENTE